MVSRQVRIDVGPMTTFELLSNICGLHAVGAPADENESVIY
jgi:hypothetical protein